MNLIKDLVLKFIFNFGIYSLFHFINRKKITILYAHSIVQSNKINLAQWQPLRTFHNSDDLTSTLKVLNTKYQFISLSTAIKILKKEIKPLNNALVITLDDGYLNNIEVAGPIFSHFNISPTIFVSSEHTDKNIPFWFDRLDYALQQIKDPSFSTQILKKNFLFDCSSREDLTNSYADFRQQIKSSFNDDKAMRSYLNQLALEIENHTGKSLMQITQQDMYASLASWDELKLAQKNLNYEIGSHTINHARLGRLSEQEITHELAQSKKIIENKLSSACTTFCYPDNNYNVISKVLTKTHYQSALTTDPELNKIGDDIMDLRRLNLPSDKNPFKILFKISALRLTLRKISG